MRCKEVLLVVKKQTNRCSSDTSLWKLTFGHPSLHLDTHYAHVDSSKLRRAMSFPDLLDRGRDMSMVLHAHEHGMMKRASRSLCFRTGKEKWSGSGMHSNDPEG